MYLINFCITENFFHWSFYTCKQPTTKKCFLYIKKTLITCCDDCEKLFTRKSVLSVHMHSGHRINTCWRMGRTDRRQPSATPLVGTETRTLLVPKLSGSGSGMVSMSETGLWMFCTSICTDMHSQSQIPRGSWQLISRFNL